MPATVRLRLCTPNPIGRYTLADIERTRTRQEAFVHVGPLDVPGDNLVLLDLLVVQQEDGSVRVQQEAAVVEEVSAVKAKRAG